MATPSARILFVEDQADIASLVRIIFRRQGVEVIVAESGPAGLAVAHQTPFDLILLDVRLPGMDGFQVCRRLKEDEQLREIPVIFFTGLDDPQSHMRGLELGAVDYIPKPMGSTEFFARVRPHLHLPAAVAGAMAGNSAAP